MAEGESVCETKRERERKRREGERLEERERV
jgi:hypothetical protein